MADRTADISGQNVAYMAPPNPPPYTPYQPQSQPIIVQPGMTVVVNPVGSKPTTLNCKSCNATVVTRLNFSPSMRTHLLALLLCVVGCWPFACVPYCIDTCNNVDHYCPNCGAFIGSYQN